MDMSKHDITISDSHGLWYPKLSEKQERLLLWKMILDDLAQTKANVFLKYEFKGSERLNQILKNNKWYRKAPLLRQDSLVFGSAWIMYHYSDITNDITLKMLHSINVQYVDDTLIYFTGTNMDIYPDTTKVYDYFEYRLVNNQYVEYLFGKLTYIEATFSWNKDYYNKIDERNNFIPFILLTNRIPITELPNGEKAESLFKNKGYLINLYITHLLKIKKDVLIGTNKFLINVRGVPNGKAFIQTLKQYEEILENGTIVTDQMLMINPNSANPLDRMYGSLQSEQLWYGAKMVKGTLRELCLITTNSSSKTSAQQNTLEITQENQLIDNDNKKNQYIWENALTEMAYGILKYENDIIGANNDLTQNITCTIELAKNPAELHNETNNKKVINGK